LLRCLTKLDNVIVNIALLQDTGIGRTVSILKKHENDVGTKSRDLVNKWKEIVAREESEEEKEEVGTGDEEHEHNGTADANPPAYIPTPIAPAYVPTPLSELKTTDYRGSIDGVSEHPDSEPCEQYGNDYEEMEVVEKNGKESDEEHHRKSKKHKKDKEREKDKKDKHREKHEEHKSKSKKKKSHREHAEDDSDHEKKEKYEKFKKEEIVSSSSRKDKKEEIMSPPSKKEKYSSEDKMVAPSSKKDKHGSEDMIVSSPSKKDKHSSEDRKDKHSSRGHKKDRSSHEENKSDKKDKNSHTHREEKDKSKDHKGIDDVKSSSKQSDSRHTSSDKEKSREKEKDKKHKDSSHESKSHKDRSRDEKRTKEKAKEESDRKHSSSGSRHKDKSRNEMEESRGEKSDKHRSKDKKKKHNSTGAADFDMFAGINGFDKHDKKHKKRTRDESEDEIVRKDESHYKPKSKQPKVDSSADSDDGDQDFSSMNDHKKFTIPSPPRMVSNHISGPSLIPDISPNYKPLPRPPLTTNQHKTEPDENMLDFLIGTKGKRQAAVYSGAKRTGFKGPVPTLRDQCIQILQVNVDSIDECGGLGFDILEPILERASAETLMHIEDYNPYLMEDTSKIWERFCKKDFRNKQRNADDFESWREMYERCTRERDEKLSQLMEKVASNYNARGESRESAGRQTKITYMDSVPKPPRNVARQQAKHGTALPVGHSLKVGNSRPKLNGGDPTAMAARPVASKKPKVAPMMAKVKRFAKGMMGGGRR